MERHFTYTQLNTLETPPRITPTRPGGKSLGKAKIAHIADDDDGSNIDIDKVNERVWNGGTAIDKAKQIRKAN